MSTVTVSITFDPQEMTGKRIDQLIQCWRDDVEFNKARVTDVTVTGPWVEK